MKAIIYAAGRGTRLSADRPKALLEIGGKTLLERHAEHLATIGVHRLLVVTGHLREEVLRHLEALRARFPLELAEVLNPDFREGSVLSFGASLPELREAREPVLLMDGDVLYPRALLERLARSAHRTALLIDRSWSAEDDDPVLVPIRGGRPVDLRKRWRGEAEAVGESVGFFKVDPADLPLLIEETERRCRGAAREEPYEEVLRSLVVQGRFGHEDITGMPWTEIDFPRDLERAETVVLPALRRFEAGEGKSVSGP